MRNHSSCVCKYLCNFLFLHRGIIANFVDKDNGLGIYHNDVPYYRLMIECTGQL